uniref:Uncharacterized protein n=1 Tax=Meloidogyne incognita TaxID=6306 RepID=A0A914MXC3_MELIC
MEISQINHSAPKSDQPNQSSAKPDQPTQSQSKQINQLKAQSNQQDQPNQSLKIQIFKTSIDYCLSKLPRSTGSSSVDCLFEALLDQMIRIAHDHAQIKD